MTAADSKSLVEVSHIIDGDTGDTEVAASWDGSTLSLNVNGNVVKQAWPGRNEAPPDSGPPHAELEADIIATGQGPAELGRTEALPDVLDAARAVIDDARAHSTDAHLVRIDKLVALGAALRGRRPSTATPEYVVTAEQFAAVMSGELEALRKVAERARQVWTNAVQSPERPSLHIVDSRLLRDLDSSLIGLTEIQRRERALTTSQTILNTLKGVSDARSEEGGPHPKDVAEATGQHADGRGDDDAGRSGSTGSDRRADRDVGQERDHSGGGSSDVARGGASSRVEVAAPNAGSAKSDDEEACGSCGVPDGHGHDPSCTLLATNLSALVLDGMTEEQKRRFAEANGGLSPDEKRWAGEFAQEGVATVVASPDSRGTYEVEGARLAARRVSEPRPGGGSRYTDCPRPSEARCTCRHFEDPRTPLQSRVSTTGCAIHDPLAAPSSGTAKSLALVLQENHLGHDTRLLRELAEWGIRVRTQERRETIEACIRAADAGPEECRTGCIARLRALLGSDHVNIGAGGGDEDDDPLTKLRRAVREMAIEECAKVAEACMPGTMTSIWAAAQSSIAEDIRALLGSGNDSATNEKGKAT